MPKPASLSDLGEIMQLAWLPRDFDAAVTYWTETMGVGPFYLLEKLSLGDAKYRGQPTDAIFSVAIAYWGDIQIELIRPDNDGPAHYSGDHAIHDGMHHVCILVDDIARARAVCAEAGAEVVFEGKVAPDGEVIYVDPGHGPGGIVEILQPITGFKEFCAMVKAAGENWDGSDPLRTLG